MRLDKNEIRKNILLCFKKNNRPNDENLNLFLDDLVVGIETGWWDSRAKPSSIIKKSELELMQAIQDFSHNHDSYENEKDIIRDYLIKISDFYAFFKCTQDVFLSGDTRLKHYSDVWGSNSSRMVDLEESLKLLSDALQKDFEEIPEKPRGRRKDYGPYILTRHVFVMADCLLGVSGSRTNGETLFNSILRVCLDVAGYATSECKLYIDPCFKDISVIMAMEGSYRQYGRLDEFQQHIQKTEFSDELI